MNYNYDYYDDNRNKELVFPGLLNNHQYADIISKNRKSYYVFLLLTFACLGGVIAFMMFAIQNYVMPSEKRLDFLHQGQIISMYNPDYTKAITYAVLAGVFFVLLIICMVIVMKCHAKINEAKFNIKTNRQYADFIKQGFSYKEAYKYTLEWADRQKSILATKQAGQEVATSVYISSHNRRGRY